MPGVDDRAFLRGERSIEIPSGGGGARAHSDRGRRENNLANMDVWSLWELGCVTGVSGSGKRTLVEDVLYKALSNRCTAPGSAPVSTDASQGSSSSTRSSRSTSRRSAARRDRTPRPTPAFSTRSASCLARRRRRGRAATSLGGSRSTSRGALRGLPRRGPDQDRDALPARRYVPCEKCKGSRYNRETLEVRFKGKTIADVLEMPSRRRSSSSPTSRRSGAACRPSMT